MEPSRIAYVHIAKSAGTWLRTCLEPLFRAEDVCHFRFQHQFDSAKYEDFIKKRFFSAHIGFDTAISLDAEMITVLRNPFDRIISLYYYWREVNGGPILPKQMELEEFLDYHFDDIGQDMDNAQTWQIAHGYTIPHRRKHSGMSKDEVLAKAINNLEKFAVVGVYEHMNFFKDEIERKFNIKMIGKTSNHVNKTINRPSMKDLPVSIRNKIYVRNDLDVALYDYVVRSFLKKK